ncbi:hypothetical protein [Methylobacterium sp. P1-11]|uniref:hypothetical protein n=1 Tax=Methylobacterium sp. P1-11 TaxID=2024616 RepID=UPI001FF00479|nr:hypothetical protein [Methylobacterium sp. P1-11]
MTGEMRTQALARELAHGLAALAGGSFYGSGEVCLDLQPEQCDSSERVRHRAVHRVAFAWHLQCYLDDNPAIAMVSTSNAGQFPLLCCVIHCYDFLNWR